MVNDPPNRAPHMSGVRLARSISKAPNLVNVKQRTISAKDDLPTFLEIDARTVSDMAHEDIQSTEENDTSIPSVTRYVPKPSDEYFLNTAHYLQVIH